VLKLSERVHDIRPIKMEVEAQMTKENIDKKNQKLQQHSNEAEKSKSNTIDPSDKKFHQPNRPSI
jgi:hypothetical protein